MYTDLGRPGDTFAVAGDQAILLKYGYLFQGIYKSGKMTRANSLNVMLWGIKHFISS